MSAPSPYADLLARIPVREGQVAVLGSTTRYWVYGPDDAPITVVIAHGYRGDHHGLEPVIAQLDGIRWIGPDLPGFGLSTPMTEAAHDVEGYGRWLATFMAELGLSEAVLVGHSFGSIVSSRAIADGARPRALVLINPIAVSGRQAPNRVGLAITENWYRLTGALPRRLGEWMLRHRIATHFVTNSLVKTKDRALKAWIHDQHDTYFNLFTDRELVIEAFHASLSTHVGEFAERIPMPTLLVAAELDDITPLNTVEAMRELMPDARLTVLPNVGHLIHYEAPAAAAAAIRAFLDELGPDTPEPDEPGSDGTGTARP